MPTCSVSMTRFQYGSSQTATFTTRPHKHRGGSRDDTSSPSSDDFMYSMMLAIAWRASDGGSPFLIASAAPADARGNLEETSCEARSLQIHESAAREEDLRIRLWRSSAIPDTEVAQRNLCCFESLRSSKYRCHHHRKVASFVFGGSLFLPA